MPWTAKDADKHKKGLSARQKRQWAEVANSALAKCLEDGGEQSNCEGSAVRQANSVVGGHAEMEAYHIQTDSYQIRSETHQGRKHIIVPVIMMVEGVHCGSQGPLLHLAEELGRHVGAWNGIPVVVPHPEENGVPISANSPDIVDQKVVGRVYNTQMDNGRLRAEAWIDEVKLRAVSPLALGYIMQQRPLDVSIGVFTDDELTQGSWNSEPYEGIARNHRPDHLALLPGAQGACSWEDGCGVRVNQDGGTGDGLMDPKDIKQLIMGGFSVFKLGFREIAQKIQQTLDEKDNQTTVHYLAEVYEDYFVYEVSSMGGDGRSSQSQLLRTRYSVKSDDSIEVEGDPVPVVRKVEYVTMQTNEGGETTMADKKDGKETKPTPCCPEKVELLIQSEQTRFVEKDREWLSTMSEEQIEKFLPMEKKEEPKVNKETEEKLITKEDAVKVLQEQVKTPEAFLQILPPELQASMRHGMNLYQQQRTSLIQTITANQEAGFTEQELAGKDIVELAKLAKLAKAHEQTSMYVGQGAGFPEHTVPLGDELLLPTGVKAS